MITVNAIAPGLILQTPFHETFTPERDQLAMIEGTLVKRPACRRTLPGPSCSLHPILPHSLPAKSSMSTVAPTSPRTRDRRLQSSAAATTGVAGRDESTDAGLP